MDGVLRRLQAIRQSFEHVSALSAEQGEKIQNCLHDIYQKLLSGENFHEDTEKSFCDELLFMISEIERILYTPVVRRLIKRVQVRGLENGVNDNAELKQQQECSIRPSQHTQVKETFEKTSMTEVCKNVSESMSGVSRDYWTKRSDRVHELLGNTSLRFDKNCLKRKKQKSVSWDASVVENDTEPTREENFSPPPRPAEKRSQREKYSQGFIDSFWGLTEETWDTEDKQWMSGDIICVLNCKSELRKLLEFVKERKQVRSFYIEKKPKGLAGRKGTWLTPPYSPPLVVKYGSPDESSQLNNSQGSSTASKDST